MRALYFSLLGQSMSTHSTHGRPRPPPPTTLISGQPQARAVSGAVFHDRLYLGTLNDALGPLASSGVTGLVGALLGPRIFRIDADDGVELVIGDLDATFPARAGAYGSGFFNPESAQRFLPYPWNVTNFTANQYVWWMEVFEDRLYASTFDLSTFAQFATEDSLKRLGVSDASQRSNVLLFLANLALVNPDPPGFDLWWTDDGVRWQPVTTSGFGDPWNYGGRTMKATRAGLFVGTANPFNGAQVWRLWTDQTAPQVAAPAASK